MSRNRNSQDSLELFLDTICNMFGGFLFLMLFVVVSIRMATDSKREEMRETGIKPVSDVEVETLNIDLEKLRKELENLEQGKEKSREFVESLIEPELLEKYRETVETLDSVQDTIDETEETEKLVADTNKRVEDLKSKNEELRDKLNLAKKNLDDAEKLKEQERKENVRTTTAPKMQSIYLAEIPVFIKFGRVYFWRKYDINGEVLSALNDDDFLIVEEVKSAFVTVGYKTEPKPWRGVDLNAENFEVELTEAFKRFKNDRDYFAIVVAHDSFSEYNILSKFLKSKGFFIRPMTLPEGECIVDRGGYNGKAQ